MAYTETMTFDMDTTSRRCAIVSIDSRFPALLHGLKFESTSDDTAARFEPMFVVATFHIVQED